jgi:hypothetical protein
MSTGGFDNWLGSISEIGAIYPLVGGEGLWVLICLGFWIWWHVAPMKVNEWGICSNYMTRPTAPGLLMIYLSLLPACAWSLLL